MEGRWSGHVAAAGAAYTRAATPRQAAVSGRVGTSAEVAGGDQRSDRVAGRHQQHLGDGPRAAAGEFGSGEHRDAEQSDRQSPAIRLTPNRVSPPVNRSSTAAMMGDAAISRPVSELEMWRSASDSSSHAAMISKNANASTGRQCLSTGAHAAREERQRQQHGGADRGPRQHQDGHRNALDRDLDQAGTGYPR